MTKPIIFFISTLFLGLWLNVSLQAKDGVEGPLAATQPTETQAVSHEIWNTLVNLYVSDKGAVNYKGFKQSKGRLDIYLQQLSQNPPQSSWSRNEEMAYWINLYNAATVALIVENYPLKSIMDLGKPWDKAFIKVGDKTYNLNQVEHEILRPKFQDPRIHFAVNCASQSCPELLNEAYTAAKLDQQLDKQTKTFINNPKHNSGSEVSQLFNWYKDDFTKKGSVVDFLNKYASKPFSGTLRFRTYDWNLNE